jgi:hypothetical protein
MEPQHELAKLHPAPFPQGLHCSAAGAFVNNVSLLRRVHGKFGRVNWAPRDSRALSVDLGSGYCLEVDAQRLLPELKLVANALNKRDLSAAKSILATIGLPAFPKRTNGRLNGPEQARLAKALGQVSLLKGDEGVKNPDFEAEHPRQPKNSPGGVSGQFAPKPESASTPSATAFDGERLSRTARATLKRIVGKEVGMESSIPGGHCSERPVVAARTDGTQQRRRGSTWTSPCRIRV